MELVKLTKEDISEIYNKHLISDFPADEVKPLSRIIEMYNDGYYFAYGMYENDELLGYAYFVEDTNSVLLDYFAIVKDRRNSGFGSIFLKELISVIKDKIFVLESEYIPSAKNEDEREVRTKRVSFYLRNGMTETGVVTTVFGVDYTVMTAPPLEIDNAKEVISSIYERMFIPKFKDNFKIW